MSGKVKDLGAGRPRIRKRGSVDWPAGVLRCESLQGVGKGGWKEGSQPKRKPQALVHRFSNCRVCFIPASSLDVFFRWLFDIYYLEQASVRFQ